MEPINSVESDPTFSLPSAQARSTRALAHHLSSWIPEHVELAGQFEKRTAHGLPAGEAIIS